VSTSGRRTVGDLARGLAALVGLVALVVGVPVGLVTLVGWPLPTTLPSSDAVADALARTGVSDGTVVKIVACVLWVAWAQVAVGVVAEVTALVRRRDLRIVPACGPLRRLAASLVASATVLVTTANAAPLPPLRSVAVASAAPLPAIAGQPFLSAPAPHAGPTWTVRPRDTLWGIAEQTLGRGERWADIRRANVGRSVAPGVTFTERTEVLRPGWVLALPADATVDEPDVAAPGPEPAPPADGVVVAVGDSLSSLAARCYGDADRWPELWEANRGRDFDGRRFVDPNLILPGWSLVVPGAVPTGAPVGPPPAPAPAASAPDPATARAPAPEPTIAPAAEPAPPPPISAPVIVARSPLAPAAAEDVGVPAAAPARVERPAWVVPAAIAGLALLATGVAGLAASRRRRRLRAIGLHHALPVVDPDLAATAAAVSFGADPVGMARLDVALRYLAARLPADGGQTARPLLVRRSRPGTLEVTVDRPLPAVPAHWRRGADASCVVLPPEVPIAVLVDGAGAAPSPCPALVMFGLDDDAELYVDLEALGLVTLEGAPETVAAIARAVVATLAVSPLADLVHVVTSGVDCYGFATEERVQSGPFHVPSDRAFRGPSPRGVRVFSASASARAARPAPIAARIRSSAAAKRCA
jgi:nucleoid-associated protein YgaU